MQFQSSLLHSLTLQPLASCGITFCKIADLVLLTLEGTWVLGKTFLTQHADSRVWDLLTDLLSQPSGEQLDFKDAVAAQAADVLVDLPQCLLSSLEDHPAAEARAQHLPIVKAVGSYIGVINQLLDRGSEVSCNCSGREAEQGADARGVVRDSFGKTEALG